MEGEIGERLAKWIAEQPKERLLNRYTGVQTIQAMFHMAKRGRASQAEIKQAMLNAGYEYRGGRFHQ
jgi:hypothetical protein